MTRNGKCLPAVLGALLAGGCAADADTGPVHVDEFPLLTAVEEQRIGSVEDPEVGFTFIGDVVVDHHGHLVVSEIRATEIRLYDGDGQVLRRYGGRGDGPGEFRGVATFGVVGDTVWVYDFTLERLTLFHHDGTLLSARQVNQLRVPFPSCAGYIQPEWATPEGGFLGAMTMKRCASSDPPSDVAVGDSIPVPRVRFHADGAVDTVGWDRSPPPTLYSGQAEPETRLTTIGNARYMVPTPPEGHPSWLPLPDGRIEVETEAPLEGADALVVVRRLRDERDTLYVRHFALPAPPYDEAELDSVAVLWARRGGIGSRPETDQQVRTVAARLRAEMDYPPYQFPYGRFWVDDEEGLWILRNRGMAADTERWAVLDPAGRARGQVDLPKGARPLAGGGNVLWAAQPDDFDVPWLVRYRLGGG